MKKLLKSLFLVLVLVLAGCGSKLANSKYLGTWEAFEAEYQGITMKASDVYEEFSMTFKDDGSFTVTLNGDTEKGNWEEKDGKAVLKDSTTTMEVELNDDGYLVVKERGVTLLFKKK